MDFSYVMHFRNVYIKILIHLYLDSEFLSKGGYKLNFQGGGGHCQYQFLFQHIFLLLIKNIISALKPPLFLFVFAQKGIVCTYCFFLNRGNFIEWKHCTLMIMFLNTFPYKLRSLLVYVTNYIIVMRPIFDQSDPDISPSLP